MHVLYLKAEMIFFTFFSNSDTTKVFRSMCLLYSFFLFSECSHFVLPLLRLVW